MVISKVFLSMFSLPHFFIIALETGIRKEGEAAERMGEKEGEKEGKAEMEKMEGEVCFAAWKQRIGLLIPTFLH